MLELTNVQYKVMEFIFNHMDTTGTPPTIREIASHFHWKAIGSAQDVIAALRKKGLLLSPVPGKSRQIVPTQETTNLFFENFSYTKPYEHKNKFIKNKKILNKQELTQFLPGFEDLLRVPLVGLVKAGVPHEAIENAGEFITFPFNTRSTLKGGKTFALLIDGYSMINAGFLPNDIILVESATTAKDREIVIASLQNSETTLKRYAHKGSPLYKSSIKFLLEYKDSAPPPAILVPENPDFTPLPFGNGENDKIIGVVRALYRKSIF